MIAFKTWASNPNNPWTSLQYYPEQIENISEEMSGTYLNNGWSVLEEQAFESYKALHNNELINFEQEKSNSELKIFDLISSEFKHYHPSKIDFTFHLKTGIILYKKVTMSKSGRPIIAKYYWPEEVLDTNLVAEIKFEFQDNSSKFMIERKELLGYATKSNNIPDYYLIHHRKYNFSNIQEARVSLQERVGARNNIIQEIKIVAQLVLTMKYIQQGYNTSQASMAAIQEGTIFFTQFKDEISAFIEVAAPNFKSSVLNNSTYDWLNNYAAPNVTLRLFIVDRLTY